MPRTILTLVLITIVSAPLAIGQNKRSVADPQDPQAKDRKVKREPDGAFIDWLRDVSPIISKEEEDAFRKLRTNEERQRFIEMFWGARDPDPDTEENEYREEYYERVAYVNEHFSSGMPGYKTDRGRIYLKYGKPDEVESHPTGGSYQRELSEGAGSTSTYPFERWFYRNIPGRSGADIEFVDPTSTGEYRLARNPFEKDAMLHVPGAAPTMNGISQGDIALAANGVGNPFSSRESESPFAALDLLRILNSPLPAPKNDVFAGKLSGSDIVVEDNPISFQTAFGFFRLDENRVVTTITVQTENAELSFRDSGGVQVATANIVGRILNVAGRRVNYFEDVVTTTATTQELVEARSRKSAYQKTIVLPPGVYKADLIGATPGAAPPACVTLALPSPGLVLNWPSLRLCCVRYSGMPTMLLRGNLRLAIRK